jgi:hypothetical protein
MKSNFLRNACVATVLVLFLGSCQKELLTEESSHGMGPTLQGVATNCGATQTVAIANSAGSTIVDYCDPMPCQVSTPWGTISYTKETNGAPNASLRLDVTLAPGWFAEGYSVVTNPPNSIQTNGNVPVVDNNWTTTTLAPAQASFSVTIPLPASLYGASCFEWAIEINALRFNLFGQPDNASRRNLYAYDPGGAGSPFIIDDCYAACPSGSSTETQGTCQGCRAAVTVNIINCSSVNVSSCKDIRQVVIVYDNCTREYHDNLSGTNLSFTGNGGTISHVYVRSGCRANSGNAQDDTLDRNGFTYHNIRRFQFNGPCLNPSCN